MNMIDRIPDKYAERAFMGKNEEQKAERINKIAEILNSQKILNPVNNSEKTNVNNETVALIQQLGRSGEWQANDVASLIETAKDPNRSVNRKVAEERLDVLAKATYIAMKYGDNKVAVDAIQGGSTEKMMEVLPKAMRNKEFVERVRDLEITNPEIQEILNILDKKGRVLKVAGEGGKKALRKNLEEGIEKLACLDNLNPKEDEQMMRVSAYLGSEVDKINEKKSTLNENSEQINDSSLSRMEEYAKQSAENTKTSAEHAKASAEYAQNRAALDKQVEKVSLNEILDSYLKIKAPRERTPQMWEYQVPSFLEGKMSQEKWRKLLNFEDAWLGAIYSKRQSSEYNNSLEKMKDGILNMKSLSESAFKTWYEDENINLKGVMHQISRELLTEKTITQGNLSRRIYTFDTRINPVSNKEEYIKGSRVQEFVDNEDVYKEGLAERLVRNKIVSNIEVAKLAVSLSMDVMEMGGVFSEADGLRKLSWESDALRIAQRPERKFSLKVGGGELFAGPWTELANTLSQGDFKETARIVKDWGVVPELLAGSFLDQKIDLPNGGKKTMMEMIYNNQEIPLKDRENDMFFGWRKDHIMPAARMWMYITNKLPLEFSKQREFDNVISEWRTDLFNDINQLRKNDDALLPTSVVEGAIGGSIGLWPFAGPYLRIGAMQDPDRNKNYFTYCEEIFRAMGLNEPEKNRVKEFFGVDKKYMYDFGDKIADLKVAQNMNSNQKLKRDMWSIKHLLKPRK